MDLQTSVKIGAGVVGAIVAFTLVTQHPIQVALLAVCAGAYIYAEKKLT